MTSSPSFPASVLIPHQYIFFNQCSLILSYPSPIMLLVPSCLLIKTLTLWLILLPAYLPVLAKATGHIFFFLIFLPPRLCPETFSSIPVNGSLILFQFQFRCHLREIHTDFIFLMSATLHMSLCDSIYYLFNKCYQMLTLCFLLFQMFKNIFFPILYHCSWCSSPNNL